MVVAAAVSGAAGAGLVGWWGWDWWRAERWFTEQARAVEAGVREHLDRQP